MDRANEPRRRKRKPAGCTPLTTDQMIAAYIFVGRLYLPSEERSQANDLKPEVPLHAASKRSIALAIRLQDFEAQRYRCEPSDLPTKSYLHRAVFAVAGRLPLSENGTTFHQRPFWAEVKKEAAIIDKQGTEDRARSKKVAPSGQC